MKKLFIPNVIGLLVCTVSASAIPINGEITFSGVALLDNANSALATQATIGAPTVTAVSGDFTPSILVGQTPTMSSPLVIGATPAFIWTLGGFTFTPTGPITGGGAPNNSFALGVSGIVDDGPGGFDPTLATFALTTTPTIGGLGAFTAITISGAGTTSVPDGGSTLMFLSGALGTLGWFKRRLAHLRA